MTDSGAVDIRRAQIDAAGSTYGGWVAAYDGTETIGISREDALTRLVVAVAQEGHL